MKLNSLRGDDNGYRHIFNLRLRRQYRSPGACGSRQVDSGFQQQLEQVQQAREEQQKASGKCHSDAFAGDRPPLGSSRLSPGNHLTVDRHWELYGSAAAALLSVSGTTNRSRREDSHPLRGGVVFRNVVSCRDSKDIGGYHDGAKAEDSGMIRTTSIYSHRPTVRFESYLYLVSKNRAYFILA